MEEDRWALLWGDKRPRSTDNRFPKVLCEQDKGALLHPLTPKKHLPHAFFFFFLVFVLVLGSKVWDHSHFKAFFSLSTIHMFEQHKHLSFFLSTSTFTSCLHCSCQMKVLLRIHRIHTVTSTDRMSPTLPQINPPGPHPSPLSCTHLHPPSWVRLLMWCHLLNLPISTKLFSLRWCCNKEATSTIVFLIPAWSDMLDLSPYFIYLYFFPHLNLLFCDFWSDSSSSICLFSDRNAKKAALTEWPFALFDHWLSYGCLHDS